MPTYEYRCNACHRDFEYQQRMSDPDLVKCEACGEDKLEKLISRTAFQLKGSGWYKDLYSSNPKEAMKSSVDKGVPPKASEATTTSSPASESGSSSSSASSTSSASGTSTASGGGGSSSSSSAASSS
ncbi:MAG TPA: zinc ribbon domain-containing protein [Kofleriaceae bacterium]|jgi:putative FmdB family regulatory protein|nr:zinc ribbon domain-containing protein [Kofleriaceae bacterium]